jgi:FAD:protein FMN transferase
VNHVDRPGHPLAPNRVERSFRSMGCDASVRLESAVLSGAELEAEADGVRATLEDVERALSRFRADSELSAINRDQRAAVPASLVAQRLAVAIRWAGRRSGGLVDGTLLHELERQGYDSSRDGVAPAPLDEALAAAPARSAAHASAAAAFTAVGVDGAGSVVRPPGVALDSGGLGKGLAADLAAERLSRGVRYAIGCGGDLAVGGWAGIPWQVAVRDARTGGEAHRLRLKAGGVATSGIDARLWRRPDGRFAHHLLDPATGEPAWTGLVAATAVADNALEAEVLAKTALLSGPGGARRLLHRRGGVLQHDSGRVEVVSPVPVVRFARGAIVRAAA